jgi:hypothetical protein
MRFDIAHIMISKISDNPSFLGGVCVV